MSEEFSHGYALLIGVGESAYPRLSLPVTLKDTQAIYAALIDPELSAYSEKQIRVLNNKEAIRENIVEGMNWLKEQAEVDPEAMIFIYYSGHGYLNVADNQYYLLPHDIDVLDIPSSALAAESFIEALRKITAEKLLVVIDSCHAAGMATSKDPADILSADKAISEKLKGLNAVSPEPSLLEKFTQSKGRVVLTSSRGEQKSWIGLDERLSIYTHHFLEALQGASNKTGDTEVTVSNLIKHLGKAVPQSVMEQYKQEQTPIADMTNAEDFVIAKLKGGKGFKGWQEEKQKAEEKIQGLVNNINITAAGDGSFAAQKVNDSTVVTGSGNLVGNNNQGNVLGNNNQIEQNTRNQSPDDNYTKYNIKINRGENIKISDKTEEN